MKKYKHIVKLYCDAIFIGLSALVLCLISVAMVWAIIASPLDLLKVAPGFLYKGALSLWLLAIGIQPIIWAVVAFFCANTAIDYIRNHLDVVVFNKAVISTVLIVFGALILHVNFLVADPDRWPPKNLNNIKLNLLVLEVIVWIGLAVGAFAIFLMMLARFDLVSKSRRFSAINVKTDFVTVSRIRHQIEQYLAMLSLILGMAVIATAALVNTFNHTVTDDKDKFSTDYVIVYGAFYSVILVLAYLPCRVAIVRAGNKIINNGVIVDGDHDVIEFAKMRSDLRDSLKLDLNNYASFGSAFGIIAPLAIAWITTLLKSAASS